MKQLWSNLYQLIFITKAPTEVTSLASKTKLEITILKVLTLATPPPPFWRGGGEKREQTYRFYIPFEICDLPNAMKMWQENDKADYSHVGTMLIL